jgi:VacB/RNase II family 3'-5' exoribonuclease
LESLKEFKDLCNEKGEYVIPEEERKRRLDLTKETICTVDPLTARDLDDALSINEVEEGIYEVGVHIADVSHFVKPGSLVDLEAKLRTTSVYLVHRVIPMLPRILCENLCSLNPGVERLAFSVFFYIKKDGTVLWDRKIRKYKSIIKSCAKLSYDIVNKMIEGSVKSIEEIENDYK